MQIRIEVLNRKVVWLYIYYNQIQTDMKIKSKIIKWFLIAVVLIGGTGAVIGYKMINKQHRNVEAAAALNVTAINIANEYETNEAEANKKYLDKVLEVTGTITGVTKNQKAETVIALKGTDMSGLLCTIEGTFNKEFKADDAITLRGICTGYLTDVILVRCAVQAK